MAQYTYTFSEPAGTSLLVTTSDTLVDVPLSNGTTAQGFPITGLSGTYRGEAITGLYGLGGQEQYFNNIFFDNTIFPENNQGYEGSTFGIDVRGIALSTASGVYNVYAVNGSFFTTDTNLNIEPATLQFTNAPCYATGTLIRTDGGEVAVEHLAVGDVVVTAAGEHRPIRWIGHRRLDCSRHPRPETVWPVRIRAGAFGKGLPTRDLWLSPDHAVRVSVLDAVLIPVKHLINDATIAQVEAETVTYWHVELDSHDILLAEGLPAESFLDTGVRACFENGAEHTVLHPDFTPLTLDDFCLPLVQEGVIVDAVRTRLLARAAASGWTFTAEDDLHALVDGVVVRPRWDGAIARFAIPAEAREVRLVSRSFVPERIDVTTRDGRRLGVPLRGLSAIDGAGIVRSLPIDHASLAEGYSFVQDHEGDRWRWTDGNAVVPAALWAGTTGDVILTVETAPDRGTLRAWLAPEPIAPAAPGEDALSRDAG